MKRKGQNTSKGITLIALVITIIVLLILAGVAINMAIDSDGLFGKAKEATEKWNTAAEKESTEITNLLEIANNVGGNSGGGNDDDGNDDDDTSTLPVGWDETKVANIVTETVTVNGEQITRNAPIPVGYVASQITADEDGKGAENTIADGLVIYQGTDPVTGVAGSEAHTTAMTTRNQFVWIPVDDIDYMVMCKSNASGSVCDLELVDGVLQCTNIAHTTTATDLCGRLYEIVSVADTTSYPRNYTASANFIDQSQIWDATGGQEREPDVLSASDSDDNIRSDDMTRAGIESGKVADFESQLKNDFKEMATSVAKYGGFWVTRFEAGEKGASLKNQKVLVSGTSTETGQDESTFLNGDEWYGMYNILRRSEDIDKTVVNTHMIWGCQFDMIIKFLGENPANEPLVGHATRQLSSQELTGETTTDIMSNIYDLEGNNSEWTMEAVDNTRRGHRGGSFRQMKTYLSRYPAAHESGSSPGISSCFLGSRVTMYL